MAEYKIDYPLVVEGIGKLRIKQKSTLSILLTNNILTNNIFKL